MYYPSFFAGVRPYETLRERVDNPLDLSVKQTVSRPEGSCPTEHEDFQLLRERKLAVAGGLSSQTLTQQMPLLDNMFAYKPFGAESVSCQMRGPTALFGQNMNSAYCSTTSSGHPMSHLSLVPDMLHQNTNPLTMEATTPLSSFAINGPGLPYHMRIGSAATAAAVMANQRAYFGHSPVLTPHMSAPFSASIPHISLYNDLMSDMSRRVVEPETSVFGTLSSLRTAPDPTTRFSEHLQRLRGQQIQQSKCSGPCCLPSLHGNHSNGCNCCDVGLVMPSNVSALVMPSPHSAAVSVPISVSIPCNDVCNRDMISNNPNHSLSDKKSSNNNNNNENKNSFEDNSLISSQSFQTKDFELKSQSCAEIQTRKSQFDCISCAVPNRHLWNPSLCNKHVAQAIDCHNNHSDKSGPNSNDIQKECFSLNSSVSDKRETGFVQNNSQEVITLDEKSNESQNVCKEEIGLNSSHIFDKIQKCESSDQQNKSEMIGPLSKSDIIHISSNSSDFMPNKTLLAPQISNQICEQIEHLEGLKQNLSNNSEPRISAQNSDDISRNLSQSQPKQEFDHKVNNDCIDSYSVSAQNSLSPKLTKVESSFKESEGTADLNRGSTLKPTNSVTNITKQLKDYKPVPKHIISLDKNKKQTKETKTVEVQCDGPDWTPIVLPAQLKNKLHKVIRKKLFRNNCKKFTSIRLIDHKKDSKKRKKCKQKHFHRNQSRSSSVSPNWSRKSSPERESDSSYGVSGNCAKSKKRSMLQCLVNSDGYVADKLKNDRHPNLFASDPSQLGREERALQRAIKHIEDLNKPYVRDNSLKNCEDFSHITQNNNQIDENKSNDSDSNHIIKESHISKKISESYEKIIESVVNQSLQNEFCDQTNKTKKSKDCEVSTIIATNDRTEPLLKIKAKTKRKLLDHSEQQQVDNNVSKKSKKKYLEQNKCDNKVIKLDQSIPQTNPTKQKKGLVTVRRRRFRSGLDMIRNAHRRKKARSNAISAPNARQEANSSVASKTNEESANGSVPTEMKRLMVNKALGETLLHRAARSNRLDVVNVCLQSSTCDVNARDNANYTPLHECSTRGNLQIARLLLQNGADVNASAAGGIRPIHDAIENNHIEVVRLLLSYGADPNISTYSGSTAIQLSRSKAMLKFLKGFLSDISIDNQAQAQALLSWKFSASSNILDTNQTGFDVLDGLPSDEVHEESHDFLFEISDSPMDATYRLPNLRSKESHHLSDHFMRLSDVLNKTRLTREEFIKKHFDIEIVSIGRNELEKATVRQILTKTRIPFVKNEGLTEDIVLLDDKLRNIIGIDILRLR